MRYDIFCRVIDNFGDVAVCWRLARQLAMEMGYVVRLWLDQPEVLAILRPDLDCAAPCQMLDGVEIRGWQPGTRIEAPGDIVIEGFGCGLPEQLAQSMASRVPRSLWIVLEYLSAEAWVAEHHGLPSPHPRLPLRRYFFFPGFSPLTGGLLREKNLAVTRKSFLRNPNGRASLWRDLGFAAPTSSDLTISLFGYDNENVDALLSGFSSGKQKVVLAVPPGQMRARVCRFIGEARNEDGLTYCRDRLEARLIPFLSQPRYDELLWSCDWNFVRGEDSFVRAQWACAPFVWNIYPQENSAHVLKLDAFLRLYLKDLDPIIARTWTQLWHSWNGSSQLLVKSWNALQSHQDVLRVHALRWQLQLTEMKDMATNLAIFCLERIKSQV